LKVSYTTLTGREVHLDLV